MSSGSNSEMNLRRSDRQRKLSKRAIPPYETERYKAPKKRCSSKVKQISKEPKLLPRLVPQESPVDDGMPESELTGFLKDFQEPPPPVAKPSSKSRSLIPTTSHRPIQNQDDEIQFIGVKVSVTPPAPPKTVTMPRLDLRPSGKLVNSMTMVRFRNCSTDKPEIHIQSTDFPDYDHVYIAENKRMPNGFRFYCAKEFDRMLYAEIKVDANGAFGIVEYGKHRTSCCIRSKGFEEDTVRFIDDFLFVKVPETMQCTINEDQSYLIVHHTRGDFAFVFSHNVSGDEAVYSAECGCQAQAILTEAAVWVNYIHNSECPFRSLTRATPYHLICGNNKNFLTASGNILVDLSLPSDLNNSRWLASFSRFHKLPVEGHVAHVYWNRVDISHKVEFWKPICELWPLDTPSLIAHLLVGSSANSRQLERYFKARFVDLCHILGTFENVDYRKQRSQSPFVQSVVKFDGYCSALLEFVAQYFEFRLFVIKNGTGFRRYGNWHGVTTPVATINCVKNGRYEIVVGMKGIYK